MNDVVLVKKGQSRDHALRMRLVTQRMLGMYRLLDEQLNERNHVSMKDYVNETLYTSSYKWRRLKECIMKDLEKQILMNMHKIIRGSVNKTGSLGDLVFPNKPPVQPEWSQAIRIRLGNVFEKSVKTFILNEIPGAEDVTEEVKRVLFQFYERNIQLDFAVKYKGVIYVSEIKGNLNLDTEKVAKIIEKLDEISIALRDHYKKMDIATNVSLVSLRHSTADAIDNLRQGFVPVRATYLAGYSEFFKVFGIDITEKMWTNLCEKIGEVIKVFKRDLDAD